MMNKNISKKTKPKQLTLMLFIITLLLIPLQACANISGSSTLHISDLTISTDKSLYHSNQNMHIVVTFKSSARFDNAVIKLEGLNGRLSHQRYINITRGNNQYTYDFKTPRCNRCSGLAPGEYGITTYLYLGDLQYKNFTTIRIEQ